MKRRATCAVVAGLLAILSGAGTRSARGEVPEADVQRITDAAPDEARVEPGGPRKMLVFNLCRGFPHDSIPWATKAFEIMGRKTGAFEVVASEDVEMFRPGNLGQFDVVCMNNTTGELFEDAELKRSLLDFVRSGKGLVGVHAATDCFYRWADFGEMMGDYFDGHPWTEKVGVKLDDPGHPLLRVFEGQGFDVDDEIYQFRAPYTRDALRVLLSLDVNRTDMRKGGVNRTDGDFAVSWIRSYGEGRVFYCSLGHRKEMLWNPLVLRYYLDGIQFAAGDLPADSTPIPLDPDSIDPHMGEYEGTFEDGEGGVLLARAIVVAEGGGRYRAVLTAPRPVPGGGASEHARALEGGEAGAVRVEIVSAGGGAAGLALDIRTTDDPDGDRGVNYAYYEGDWDRLPEFDELTPVKTGVAGELNIGLRDRDDHFGFRFTGFVRIPEDGQYVFSTRSDDGSALVIGTTKVVDNDGLHGPETRTGEIELTAGMHPVAVTFFEKSGGEELELGYRRAAEKHDEEGVALTGSADGFTWEGRLFGGALIAAVAAEQADAAGPRFSLERITRRSPTEGIAPPEGAIVLLPFKKGESPPLDEWTNKSWRTLPDGSMQVRGGDTRTVRRFGDVWLHLEFMVPFEPANRGQGRANSGVGIMDRYEVQVLDSFGLVPDKGDCAAVYSIEAPRVNACLPPLRWQTYDVTFRAARFDAAGGVERPPVITVIHNGVIVHKDFEVPRGTGIGPQEHGRSGPVRLQDHGHPVRYRNVWVVDLEE